MSEAVVRWGARFRGEGVGAGERVALIGEPSPEWVLGLLGTWHAGGIAVPMDSRLGVDELGQILKDCRPAFILASPAQAQKVEHAVRGVADLARILRLEDPGPSIGEGQPKPEPALRTAEDTALLVYTSGTTGVPKAVQLPFRALDFQTATVGSVASLGRGDRLLSVLSLNHLFPLACGVLTALRAGAQVGFAPGILPADLLDALCEQRTTVLVAVPLLLKVLQDALERDCPAAGARRWLAGKLPIQRLRRFIFRPMHRRLGGHLRFVISGGAPLPAAMEAFFELIGLPVYHGYGMTEAGPVIAANSPRAARPRSVGRPLPGIEVCIRESGDEGVGEILTRGPHVMTGFFRSKEPAESGLDPEGWLATGDLGRLDGDGYLYVTGRLKTVIALGCGKKVQPEEVEAALLGGTGIQEVCVVGRIARHGLKAGMEEVCAVVVPAPHVSGPPGVVAAATEAEVGRLASALAPFKRPASVIVLDHPLPRSPQGKFQRGAVAALADAWTDTGAPEAHP